jgi:hypothetical protein
VIPKLEELKRLLWEEWDPIGVNDWPYAIDEYDSYAFEIWKMLQRPTTVGKIEAYLKRIESRHMGLSVSRGRNRLVAEKAMAIGAL